VRTVLSAQVSKPVADRIFEKPQGLWRFKLDAILKSNVDTMSNWIWK
jgi:hypothetical protein